MPNAIVTGATQGIGKVIAEKLLTEGFSVAICGRSRTKLDAVLAEWQGMYPESKILAITADLGEKEQAYAFAEEVLAEFKTVDLLVNNAGSYLPGTIADEPDGLLEKMISGNLYSAYYLSRKILPAMIARQCGHIFNMCSVASLQAYPNGGSYSISKYALLGFSDNLRVELRPHNIKVTSICPGAVYTPSWDGSGVPPERIMESADIAAIVWNSYNLSPQANVETIVLRPVKGDL